jgi:hypothetical protein
MARVLPFALPAVGVAPVAAPKRALLGDLLVEAGALDDRMLARALDQQAGQDQKLGRILLANRQISPDDLGAALSRQSGLGRVDLRASPPDADLLADLDPYRCLAIEAVPWRQIGGTRVIALANPDMADAAGEACGRSQIGF